MQVLGQGARYKEITSDGAITTTPGILFSITLLSGTTDSKIEITDGSGGATIWALALNGTTAAGETTTSHNLGALGVVGTSSLYADITGTGAIAYVSYKELS